MKKYLNVIIPITCLIGISIFLFIYCYNETKELDKYASYDSTYALLDMVQNQKEINNDLEKISKNSKYTIENPYIKLNPYNISPLSAIIIFNTFTTKSVNVYINEKYYTTMEESKKHAIPIYGLLENYTNKITLIMDEKKYEYEITTEKSNIDYPLEIEKSYETDDMIFTVSSYKTHLTGWDYEGNLRFYLTTDNRMDVEWLSNGHFLIGTTEGENREQFIGLMEMDYLGKIYNYYTLNNGYSFEEQILTDGTIMVAGGDKPIYFTHQMVYNFDPQDGTVKDSIDIYDVIKKIDPDFDDTYLGPKALRNGFYYDENTNELVVSFRDINTLISFNYKDKTLNWVYTTNDLFKNEVWNKYKIKVKNGRYPLGQHSPQIIDGKLAYFNNGYDRYNVSILGKDSKLSNYTNAYSSAEIYEINNLEANLIWEYNDNKNLFSIKYGSFRVDENNNKLINFGYVLKDDYRNTLSNTVKDAEANIDSQNAYIIEIDSNDEIIYKATCAESKYRVFKHRLYNDETYNTEFKTLNIINTIKDDELELTSYKLYNLDKSVSWINSLTFTKNVFKTDYDIKEDDEVDLMLMDSTGRIYILHYKDKDNKNINRIFNINLTGNYTLFIKINDVIYNTEKNIIF